MKRPNVPHLSEQPFWTAADSAELTWLAYELTRAAQAHRERCATCSAGGPWCDPLRDAFAAVDDWRRHRAIVSEARYLRARQDYADFRDDLNLARAA